MNESIPKVPQSEFSDAHLLREFLESSSSQAFEALVVRHSRMVLGTCHRVLGEAADADDAAQAVFILLWQKANQLRNFSSLAGWLHRTAHYVCRNAQRARRAAMAHEHQAAKSSARSADSPSSSESDALREILDEEIDRLPEKLRVPLILFHLEGCSLRELSVALNTGVPTVGTWLRRAREKLAAGLTRRGVTVETSTLSALLTPEMLNASAPVLFTETTVRAASVFTLNSASTGASLSPSVASFVKGGTTMSKFSTLKILSAVTCAGLLLGVAITTLSSSETTEPKKSDEMLLQGDWDVIAWEKSGTAMPESSFKPIQSRIVFAGKEVYREQTAPNGRVIKSEEGTFTLDSSQNPKTIDIELREGTVHGIYELDGDELKLCVTRGGGRRPTTFKTKQNDERSLYTYQRANK